MEESILTLYFCKNAKTRPIYKLLRIMQQGSFLVPFASGTIRPVHIQTALTHETVSKRLRAKGFRPI